MDLSVIIPTYNGEKSLSALFAILKKQTIQADEILVVDSASADGSVELCRKNGAEVDIIEQQDFDHGGTRTAMAKKARGNILLFLTQDALPARADAIEKLIAPLMQDQNVAMAYGRQLPNNDANFAAAHLRKFNYPSQTVIRCYEDRNTLGIQTIFTSNSFAAYRRSALAEVGYFKSGLIFGEDTCAAGRILQKGLKLTYVSEAAVYHSHNYRLLQEFKRSFDIGVLHTMEAPLFNDFGKAESRGVEYVRSGVNELLQKRQYVQTVDFVARSMMKLLGYMAGRNFDKFPDRIVPSLSLHQSWWLKEKKSN